MYRRKNSSHAIFDCSMKNHFSDKISLCFLLEDFFDFIFSLPSHGTRNAAHRLWKRSTRRITPAPDMILCDKQCFFSFFFLPQPDWEYVLRIVCERCCMRLLSSLRNVPAAERCSRSTLTHERAESRMVLIRRVHCVGIIALIGFWFSLWWLLTAKLTQPLCLALFKSTTSVSSQSRSVRAPHHTIDTIHSTIDARLWCVSWLVH